MATFLLSSMERCEGGHGLCHHILEKRRSAVFNPKKDRMMAMVIFFLSGELPSSSSMAREHDPRVAAAWAVQAADKLFSSSSQPTGRRRILVLEGIKAAADRACKIGAAGQLLSMA